ncbi:MAG: hypothetical protein OHK0040_04910 [bacterium]
MYLVIDISDFYFALPVKVIERVFDASAVKSCDEGTFLEDKEVQVFTAEKLLNVRGINSNKKTAAVLLSIKNDKPVVMLIGDVKGFVDRGKLDCKPRSELLKIYGFELVTNFCLYRDNLLFIIDEKSLEKRLAEMLWE